MRSRLIANPVAGTDQAPSRLADINDRIKSRFGPLDIVLTTGPGDARAAARDAASRGYDHVFVAGGDGTLNEVVNGLGSVEGALASITVGLLPLGTGNDFAAALGFPADPDEALQATMDAEARSVDVGRVNDRLFINVSAGGFIADVSEAVDPQLKSIAGRFAYLIGGARALLQAEPFTCTVDGRSSSCLMFAVCNAPMIGGGRLIAPDARPDDGAFDVCLVSGMELLEFVALLRRVADGTHLRDERVTYFAAQDVTLEFDRELNVNADGEVFSASRCEYHMLPGALRILAPR
jgi:diacylglycerol kinase (ATP)